MHMHENTCVCVRVYAHTGAVPAVRFLHGKLRFPSCC